MSAELHRALEPLTRDATGPQRTDAGQGVDAEMLARADRDGTARGLDVEHEPRLAVIGRDAELQPATLADGERVRAVVLAQHISGLVDDGAGLGPELVAQPAGVVAVR